MYISHESTDQTQARLQRVLAQAEMVILPDPYAFIEVSASRFPAELVTRALAFVRDEDVWSALVPSSSPGDERFVVFGFHFTPGLDNSGFVGWLATHLKSSTGSGVMVICGQNTNRGGIFDYWGAPLSVADVITAEIERLRSSGNPD
jgi:hypothetical protein